MIFSALKHLYPSQTEINEGTAKEEGGKHEKEGKHEKRGLPASKCYFQTLADAQKTGRLPGQI